MLLLYSLFSLLFQPHVLSWSKAIPLSLAEITLISDNISVNSDWTTGARNESYFAIESVVEAVRERDMNIDYSINGIHQTIQVVS